MFFKIQNIWPYLLLSWIGVACNYGCAQTEFSELMWQDEFDIPGRPDSTKWGYQLGAGGWGNNELQYYTDSTINVVVENGILKINAIRTEDSAAPFTSARLFSKGKFQIKYGKVEVRAKLPEGIGTWPAIWMLGTNIDQVGWPACGEIDIMEHRGYELNKIFGTLHYPGHFGDNANGNTLIVENATNEFNIYTVEWTKELINISTNGKLIHSVKNTDDLPFHHDFYLLLNLAIGGSFAGPVDPALIAATLEIDYVRVYK